MGNPKFQIDDVLIRPYQEKDLDTVVALFSDAFRPVDHLFFEVNLAFFRKQLRPDSALVAEASEKVVGFGTYFPLGHSQDLFSHFQYIIRISQNPHLESILREQQEYDQPMLGGEVVVEFFENDITQGESQLKNTDLYLSELVVDPSFRGRGIGPKITEEEIKLASQASVAIAMCWDGEGRASFRMYRKLGFEPLLRLGPTYPDGNSATYVGKRL